MAAAAALEAVLTPEVVGQLGEADASLAERLQTLIRENARLEREVQDLHSRSTEKNVEMADLRSAVSKLRKKMTESDIDVIFKAGADAENEAGAPATATAPPGSVTELQNMMADLQKKCHSKDQMIMALANDLRLRSQSGAFEDLLKNVKLSEAQLPEKPQDFDKEQLCKYLKVAVPSESRPTPTATFTLRVRPKCDGAGLVAELERPQTADPSASRPQASDPRDVQSAPGVPASEAMLASLTVLRRVAPDSLLLGWTVPSGCKLSGFEIFVNGQLAQKVRSPSRNKALLQSLDLNSRLVVTMYALTPQGRMSEPAYLVLPGPEDKEEEIRSTKYH